MTVIDVITSIPPPQGWWRRTTSGSRGTWCASPTHTARGAWCRCWKGGTRSRAGSSRHLRARWPPMYVDAHTRARVSVLCLEGRHWGLAPGRNPHTHDDTPTTRYKPIGARLGGGVPAPGGMGPGGGGVGAGLRAAAARGQGPEDGGAPPGAGGARAAGASLAACLPAWRAHVFACLLCERCLCVWGGGCAPPPSSSSCLLPVAGLTNEQPQQHRPTNR